MKISDIKKVAGKVAKDAAAQVTGIVADHGIASITTEADAAIAVAKVVSQDPSGISKRVWSAAISGVVAGILAYNGDWKLAAAAAVSGFAAGWSKFADPRPARY